MIKTAPKKNVSLHAIYFDERANMARTRFSQEIFINDGLQRNAFILSDAIIKDIKEL